MSRYQWIYASQPGEMIGSLTRELRIRPMLARLLFNRGIRTPAAGHEFLHPRSDRLHDGRRLAGMRTALARIMRALQRGEHIRIQGDYDVDGSSAAALLTQFFQIAGAKHSFAVPTREGEGYGLSLLAVERAREDGVALIITVDNGVTAIDQVERANELGIDVIITDHHSFGDRLPPALAIVHPGLDGHDYPFRHLCGCGVAFKLAMALAEELGSSLTRRPEFKSFIESALALTAMATISDVVPLVDENRILTSSGLAALETTSHAGLRALLQVSGVSGPISASDVSFKLGPRINAGGRMGRERLATELLTERDPARASELAAELDRLNTRRQTVERAATRSAREAVAEAALDPAKRVLVACSADWPAGVIGIVAARLVDAYEKPAVVLSLDAQGNARGSGRASRGFNLYNALKECEALLTRFGGHAYAAGLQLRGEDVPRLEAALNEAAPRHFGFEPGCPTLDIDALADAGDLDIGLARDLDALGPFGEGNPEPLLAFEEGRVLGQPRLVGKTAKHLSFFVAPPGGQGYKAIGFSLGDRLPSLAAARGVNLAFRPVLSTWGGRESLELEIKDLVPLA